MGPCSSGGLAGGIVALLAISCSNAFTTAHADGGAGGADASTTAGDGGNGASGGRASTDAGASGASGTIGSGGGAAFGGTAGATPSAGGRASGGAGGTASGGVGGRDTGGAGGLRATGGAGGLRATGGAAGNPTVSTGGSGPSGMDADTGPTLPSDGLLLWLRADRGVTSKNGLVSRWADQSPSHYDATQVGTLLQPTLVPDGINGRPALEFDGTDDFLQITQAFDDEASEVTVFTVALATGTACSAIFEASNGAEVDDISFGSYMGKVNFESLDSSNNSVPFAEGVPVVFGATLSKDGKGQILRNGVVATSYDGYTPPAMLERLQTFIGKTLYADCGTYAGMVGEVIVYGRALTLKELLDVEAQLADQFGCCTTGS